jgi:peptidoglycan/LPS O-acetylase OafA/YrhL
MPGSRPEPFKLGYRPALDGLRAVAVLAVMVYHSGLIYGGFLGVDVFFTLSGFLITTLLLEEHARAGTIAIGRFYVRRALRLLPALVAFLIFWGGASMNAPQFWVILGELLGVLFYVTNWLIIYWMAGPLDHTWSLAIEEQFYVVWPVTLLLLLRWVRRSTWIVAVLVTAAAGSLAWRLALALVAGTPFTRIYVGTDTHADGVLIGAALAVLLSRQGGCAPTGTLRRAVVALSALGLPLLLLAAPLVPGYAWGVTTLAALATGGVILDIVAGGSRVTRWLECAWLVSIGRISYGLYLWHWPVFGWHAALRSPGESAAPLWLSVLAWSLTFAAALISYHLIERPFLAYKARLSANREIEPAPAALVPPATKHGEQARPANLY